MNTELIVEELRDEVMALRFAFMTLARVLHQQQTLPMPALLEQLQAVAEQTAAPDAGSGRSSSLAGVSTQLEQLCAALSQLQ